MKSDNFVYEGRDLESMSFAENYHSRIFEYFEPYIGKRIVEVGAGSGSLTKMLLKSNPNELYQIEPSAEMFKLLNSRDETLPKRHMGFLSDVEANIESPDTFVYVNVFEHIEDDGNELNLVNSKLEKGGHICIFVPALSFLYSDFDKKIDHYRRYSKKDLERKCRDAGFEIVVSRYFDLFGIAPWYIRFIIFKSQNLSSASVKLYDKFVFPILGKIESLISPPIGKNILLVGRKK